MLKLGGVGTVLIVIFIIWCLLAKSAGAQLERGCRPVDWFGNMTTSLVAMTIPSMVETVDHGFAKTDYFCQYMLWRLFYERKWQQAITDGLINPDTGKPTADTRDDGHRRSQDASRRDDADNRSPARDTPDSDTRRPYDYPLEQ